MLVVSTVPQFLFAFLVFVVGAFIMSALSIRFGLGKWRGFFLYCWHTVFCFFYLWYALRYGGDAISYFIKASAGNVNFGFGTAWVDYVTALVVTGFGASILGAFLVFNVFGSIGLLAIDASLKVATLDAKSYVVKLARLLILLPSLSFWSSAIGKDALSFMAAGLALWAALNIGKRGFLMAFAVATMFMVRPHMAGMMIVGLSLALMFDNKIAVVKRMVYTGAAGAVTLLLVPFALEYAGVGDNFSIGSLSEYIDNRQAYNGDGDGGVDISSMSMPMQLFTYMFRPTLFEVNSVFSFFAAIDNAVLLYLFVFGGFLLLRHRRVHAAGNRVFMWAYVLMAWVVLSMVTANLGIALRQKWMFVPILIYLLISVVGRKRIYPGGMASGQFQKGKDSADL